MVSVPLSSPRATPALPSADQLSDPIGPLPHLLHTLRNSITSAFRMDPSRTSLPVKSETGGLPTDVGLPSLNTSYDTRLTRPTAGGPTRQRRTLPAGGQQQDTDHVTRGVLWDIVIWRVVDCGRNMVALACTASGLLSAQRLHGVPGSGHDLDLSAVVVGEDCWGCCILCPPVCSSVSSASLPAWFRRHSIMPKQ